MKSKFILIVFLAFVFISSTACAATFKGRVIDADTKEPIEGAVVVAYWMEERGDIAGPSTRLKNVKEILTDKNGEWMINGPKGSKAVNSKLLFTFITRSYYTRQPNFIIFKPSYCSWHLTSWGIKACRIDKANNRPGIFEILAIPEGIVFKQDIPERLKERVEVKWRKEFEEWVKTLPEERRRRAQLGKDIRYYRPLFLMESSRERLKALDIPFYTVPEDVELDKIEWISTISSDINNIKYRVIGLPKLTKREDRLRALPGPVSGEGADEKQKEFIKLINEEHRNLGLKEIHY